VGRTRKCTTSNAVPIKKKQVRKNKSSGTNFENKIFKYFTEYLRKNNIKGIVYKFPDGKNIKQPIDVIIDGKAIGYCGIECKSTYDTSLTNDKIYFSKLGHVSNETGLHQFVKQHRFLVESDRRGIMAFEFKNLNSIVLVPHQYVYEILISGQLYLTVSDLLKHGYLLDNTNGSLTQFIKNKCKVYDSE